MPGEMVAGAGDIVMPLSMVMNVPAGVRAVIGSVLKYTPVSACTCAIEPVLRLRVPFEHPGVPAEHGTLLNVLHTEPPTQPSTAMPGYRGSIVLPAASVMRT